MKGGKYLGRMLRVRNLEKYQHYRDRTPPWIKLHQETLEDYDFGELPDSAKYHALAIMLLASRTNNEIPDDPAWIARRINAKSKVDVALLVSAGFLEVYQDATEMLAESLQDAPRAGARSPSPSDTSSLTDSLPPLPMSIDTPEMRAAWAERLRERREMGSRGKQTPTQVQAQLRKLEKLAAARGVAVAVACVERSTEGHHQGVVFPEDFEEGGNGAGERSHAREKRWSPAQAGITEEHLERYRARSGRDE